MSYHGQPEKVRPKCDFLPFVLIEVDVNINLKNGDKPFIAPKPRSGHRVVYSGKKIYSFGGFNPSLTVQEYPDEIWQATCPLFKELWKFNIITNQWTRMETYAEMPVELVSHAAVAYDSILIVYGGTSTPFGETSSNLTHLCYLQTGKWTALSTHGSVPVPMYGQAVCRKGKKLYVVGGTTGYLYSLDVHSLDLETLTWSHLVPSFSVNQVYPENRYRHEMVEHEGRLYIFGGGTNTVSFVLHKLPTFNIEERSWHLTSTRPDPKRGTFPKARKCHSLVKYKNFVYIHGGTNNDTHLRDMWRLNLNAMVWQKLSAVNEKGVYFHSAAVTEEGCIYFFGGVWNSPNTRTNKLFKIYVDVPSLLTMSWEAVLKFYPGILSLDKSELLKIGIPPTLVQMM